MGTIIQLLFQYITMGLQIYEFLFFLYIIASWFGGVPRNSIGYFLDGIIQPLLRFVQQIPHKIGVIDISPIYAFILIGFVRFLVLTLFQSL